jgi:enoyl-CoA hydratase/carnithine racemase
MDASVHYELTGHVAHIVIDNATARNALTVDMCGAIADSLHKADTDGDVRAIVIQGQGEHFCSGADLRAFSSLIGASEDVLRSYFSEGYHLIIRSLARCSKPTLAVIRGACVGFGFDMALACDLRLASEGAHFGQVFGRIGLVPDGGSSYNLPKLVGLARAKELMLLTESFDGKTAAEYGVVNRAMPEANLDSLVSEWATKLGEGAPIAMRLGLQNLNLGYDGDLEAALVREQEAQLECLGSKDMMRGVQAFFAKKAPEFQGD